MPPTHSKPVCPASVIPTYEVAADGRSIKFSPCDTISYNRDDIRNYYCARCHRFMNDIDLIRKRTQAWVKS